MGLVGVVQFKPATTTPSESQQRKDERTITTRDSPGFNVGAMSGASSLQSGIGL